MRPADFLRFLHHQPFLPFRICLLDGTKYDIRHPEQLAVARHTISVAGLVADLPPPLADQDVLVAMLHVSRLEPIEPR
jgi:hypothetical protein